MTGTPGRPPRPPDRSLPLELLADLHAGALDEQQAAELRARVAADPAARATLAALDATVAELNALPSPRMPDHVAARIDATLAAQPRGGSAPPGGPVVEPASRSWRRAGWGGVVLLATAAAAGVIALSGIEREIGGNPVAAPPPLALSAADLGEGLDEALGSRDYGPLSRPAALAACLEANGIAVVGAPLGAREVTIDGRRGVLLVLPTGRIAQFRLLVVGPDCGAGTPSLIADTVVGR